CCARDRAETRCDKHGMARQIASRANRLIFARRARAFALRLSPSPRDSCTRSLAPEFLSKNLSRAARLHFHGQQIENCQEQREERQPGAGDPKENKPARMFPRRQKRLQKCRPGKEQNHRKDEDNEHSPTPGRLIPNQAACGMQRKGNNSQMPLFAARVHGFILPCASTRAMRVRQFSADNFRLASPTFIATSNQAPVTPERLM